MRISKEVISVIENSTNVAIFCHIRPDADALGSACSLKMVLEKLGKNADVYCDSEISSNYNFIKYVNKVNKPQLLEYDTAIAVDCADIGRLGKYAEKFRSYENTLSIDHHITNDNFAAVNFVMQASSTGEILYNIYRKLGVEFDKDIASALYGAISSDTGCYMHNNTTPSSHIITGYLMKHNIDFAKINYFLFKRRSFGQIRLQQIALANLKFYCENRIAIIYLRANDYKECNINTTDSYGIVDTCINIEKVEIGILVSEIKPNLYTCSIRGKGSADVSVIAKEFGGGGHTNAAGCNIFGSCNTVINKLIRASRKVLN